MAGKWKNWRPFKNLFTPKDICFYSAQRPLLLVCLISSLIPYKITKSDSNTRLKISVLGFVILILHLSFFGFCYFKTLTAQESIVSFFFKSEISLSGRYLGDTLQLILGFMGICTAFLYSLLKREKFLLWFKTMAKIDAELKIIGVETDYQSTLKFIFLVLLIKFIFFNTYLLGSWILFKIANLSPHYFCWVVFFMPHIFISIIVVLFICFIKQIKHRFFLLNKASSLSISLQ